MTLFSVPPSESPDWSFLSTSEADTRRLGAALASVLQPGCCVGLVGPLGAGKTRLVQAIAVAAGVVDQPVNSPTFTLVHEYDGRWPIRHFDTYRLSGSDELLSLGIDEYLAGDGVCLIEWANRVADLLPPDAIWIHITPIDDSTRRFEFHSASPAGKLRVVMLIAAMGANS